MAFGVGLRNRSFNSTKLLAHWIDCFKIQTISMCWLLCNQKYWNTSGQLSYCILRANCKLFKAIVSNEKRVPFRLFSRHNTINFHTILEAILLRPNVAIFVSQQMFLDWMHCTNIQTTSFHRPLAAHTFYKPFSNDFYRYFCIADGNKICTIIPFPHSTQQCFHNWSHRLHTLCETGAKYTCRHWGDGV